MIIVEIRGGLGNQLFQYAYGYAQSKLYDLPFCLDLQWFKRANRIFPRAYGLDAFNITGRVCEGIDYSGPSVLIKERAKRKARINPMVTNTLRGFWVGEQFFKNAEDDIRKEFTLKCISDETQKIADEIQRINSASIHVRGADKMNIPDIAGICTPTYYTRAIKNIAEKEQDLVLYVFSDDPVVAREYIQTKHKTIFVFHDRPGGSDAEDLYLMSCCKHNIIANSTFGWWGAWLNHNDDKIIVFPNKWMNREHNIRKFIPNSWFRITK